jgi:transposase
MRTRKGQEKQEHIWIPTAKLVRTPGHPFDQWLKKLADGLRLDEFVQGLCGKFCAPRYGRSSLARRTYFRSLPTGYFESIDSERGIAWRPADSLVLRQFVRIVLTEHTPDHSMILRMRGLIALETHRAVFG